MAEVVHPTLKALYVCDDALTDPANGKEHFLGVFTAFRPTETVPPFRLGRMCVFAQLTGGIGEVGVQVLVVRAADREVVFASPVHRLAFPANRHTVVTARFRLVDCEFPSAGVYLVEMYCNSTFLDDRRIRVLTPGGTA